MDAIFRKLKGVTFYTTYSKLEAIHRSKNRFSLSRKYILDVPEMIKIIEDDGWVYEDFIEEYKKSSYWDQIPLGG